jgi:hypothetical protein
MLTKHRPAGRVTSAVMAGLVPAIPLRRALCVMIGSARVKPAHDAAWETLAEILRHFRTNTARAAEA